MSNLFWFLLRLNFNWIKLQSSYKKGLSLVLTSLSSSPRLSRPATLSAFILGKRDLLGNLQKRSIKSKTLELTNTLGIHQESKQCHSNEQTDILHQLAS